MTRCAGSPVVALAVATAAVLGALVATALDVEPSVVGTALAGVLVGVVLRAASK